MGKKEDELEVAKFAAYTAGALKQVDSSKINHGTGGPANKIDPRKFISQPVQRASKPQKQINIPGIVEAPKARSLGAETAGVANVNINELLIPTSGLDKETAEAIKRHMHGSVPSIKPPPPPPSIPTVGNSNELRNANIKPSVERGVAVSIDDINKATNYLKKKLRVIEKNQDKIIETLGKIVNVLGRIINEK